MARYAERTAVPVDQTQGEIKKLLRKAGADQIAVYESTERSSVAFRMSERFYRITVPAHAGEANAAQEERRAWRLLILLIKAKLEAVREGATTIEREFLTDMMMPDGSTVGEFMAEPLALAYREGRMPAVPLLEGPRRG